MLGEVVSGPVGRDGWDGGLDGCGVAADPVDCPDDAGAELEADPELGPVVPAGVGDRVPSDDGDEVVTAPNDPRVSDPAESGIAKAAMTTVSTINSSAAREARGALK